MLLCSWTGCLIIIFNDTATTGIYTLSLHDALSICCGQRAPRKTKEMYQIWDRGLGSQSAVYWERPWSESASSRSEEHTSELQSRRDLVCRLLLEKKN